METFSEVYKGNQTQLIFKRSKSFEILVNDGCYQFQVIFHGIFNGKKNIIRYFPFRENSFSLYTTPFGRFFGK